MINKVVVHYKNGKLLKGTTNDFFPNKALFHLTADANQKGDEVELGQLKAVFFVKELEGNPLYREKIGFTEGQTVSGRKVEVVFKDGETLVGTTLGYDPSRPGFFLVPSDPQSNNLRVFVISTSVEKFRYL